MAKVPSFPADMALIDDMLRGIVHAGGIIIRNLVDEEDLRTIQADVHEKLYNRPNFAVSDFYPKETKRISGIINISPTFVAKIIANEIYQKLARELLSSTHTYFVGDTIGSATSKPQLSTTKIFSIGPGATAQQLHRDDMIHHNKLPAISAEDYPMGRDVEVGLFVARTRTTEANGATRFIPGSHLWDTMAPPREEMCAYAELNPGDAFVMLGSCYHGGSANKTEDEVRVLYNAFMTKGYLRQVSGSFDSSGLLLYADHHSFAM